MCWLAICVLSTVLAEPRKEEPELDRWIGQMLLVGFRGTDLGTGDPFLGQVAELGLGGVILFDYDVALGSPVRNIRSLEQVTRLIERLQAVVPVPLFVGIDQEGGRVARFKKRHGATDLPSQAELGRQDREEFTRGTARGAARQLARVGVNLNFAPVLDLALNPRNPVIAGLERSYGPDPELVWRHARWTIQELHGAGVLSAVKHFPGHGSSLEDSHLDLPDVTGRWDPRELEPFRRLIAEGLPDMVMTAHLYNAEWDPNNPATLSGAVIQGLLRGRLGFDGVVISDDLQMAAIAEHYRLEEAIERAVGAGVDILLFANNAGYDPDIAPRAAGILRSLVERGVIPRERIRESYQRIMELKQKRILPPPRVD